MNVLYEIQLARTQLLREVEATFEQLICKLTESENFNCIDEACETEKRAKSYERVYPLSTEPAIFKGKKPTGVLFEENDRVNVGTWKMVFKEILQRCNADPEKHVALMNLRGKISGRERVLLSNKPKPGTMRSPLQIDENLYVETHYDTETLLRILTTRILNPVDYDYSKISIAIRNDD